MLNILTGVGARIISNSFLNVFQKILTNEGNKPSAVNFYTYLGLSVLSLCLIPFFSLNISETLILCTVIMGILGALGNYFIIKALSVGDLSSLAPINSYKPIVALIIAFFWLKEMPSIAAIAGILLIIAGTYLLHGKGFYNRTAVLYRVLALIFSGMEAVFIKKIILITNIPTSFALWAFAGLVFSFIFVKISDNNLKIKDSKHLLFLIFSVALMQYSTNYVFAKINVSYALALFQLSTLLSIFLGVNIFKEKGLKRKIIASAIMISGAIIIILL